MSHTCFAFPSIAGTHLPVPEGWKAELAWVAGYAVRQFTCPKAVTHPNVEQLRWSRPTRYRYTKPPQSKIRLRSTSLQYIGQFFHIPQVNPANNSLTSLCNVLCYPADAQMNTRTTITPFVSCFSGDHFDLQIKLEISAFLNANVP